MPLKVYYVDDEEAMCENFVDYFASDDIVVTTFSDSKSAIEAITNSRPDLLFIDYRLPETTGDKVAKGLDPSIPKFLITGDISFKSDYHFVKVFSKPYDPKEIATLLAHYLKLKSA